jgi:hypothetical protein
MQAPVHVEKKVGENMGRSNLLQRQMQDEQKGNT